MIDKNDEMILAVKRADLFNDEELFFSGLMEDEKTVKRISSEFNNYVEIRRGDAEVDVRYKQMIPYVVIRRGEEIFVYKRLNNGGEERLHGQLSIGVGGHMNRINDIRDWDSNLMLNMYRELNEELDIQYNVDLRHNNGEDYKVVGLINDDSGVGLYHIGILMIIDLPIQAEVIVRETDVLQGEWSNLYTLSGYQYVFLEEWSKIAVQKLLNDAKLRHSK